MQSIKVITDSLSDIPKELVEQLNITVLPLTVRFGKDEFKDGVDITNKEFYQRLETSDDIIPATAQVPPSEFKKAYQDAIQSGYEYIIVINGSSKVSGTHQSAIIAKQEFEKENIYVIDSESLSYGCGMIVVEIAKMIIDNKAIDEILARANEMIKGSEHIFSVDTLKYLHRNGRLSTSKMALGNLLNLKPILGIIDGKVEPIDKVRGSKKQIKRMIEISKERGLVKGARIALGHASDLEKLQELRNEIVKEIKPIEIVEAEIGPTIGTHTGPGTIAIFFTAKEKSN